MLLCLAWTSLLLCPFQWWNAASASDTARRLKQARTAPTDAVGAARARWRGERSPLCHIKHWSIHQMSYFLVTLYLMVSWAGILNTLSIVQRWKNKAAGCGSCLLRCWWAIHFNREKTLQTKHWKTWSDVEKSLMLFQCRCLFMGAVWQIHSIASNFRVCAHTLT